MGKINIYFGDSSKYLYEIIVSKKPKNNSITRNASKHIVANDNLNFSLELNYEKVDNGYKNKLSRVTIYFEYQNEQYKELITIPVENIIYLLAFSSTLDKVINRERKTVTINNLNFINDTFDFAHNNLQANQTQEEEIVTLPFNSLLPLNLYKSRSGDLIYLIQHVFKENEKNGVYMIAKLSDLYSNGYLKIKENGKHDINTILNDIRETNGKNISTDVLKQVDMEVDIYKVLKNLKDDIFTVLSRNNNLIVDLVKTDIKSNINHSLFSFRHNEKQRAETIETIILLGGLSNEFAKENELEFNRYIHILHRTLNILDNLKMNLSSRLNISSQNYISSYSEKQPYLSSLARHPRSLKNNFQISPDICLSVFDDDNNSLNYFEEEMSRLCDSVISYSQTSNNYRLKEYVGEFYRLQSEMIMAFIFKVSLNTLKTKNKIMTNVSKKSLSEKYLMFERFMYLATPLEATKDTEIIKQFKDLYQIGLNYK